MAREIGNAGMYIGTSGILSPARLTPSLSLCPSSLSQAAEQKERQLCGGVYCRLCGYLRGRGLLLRPYERGQCFCSRIECTFVYRIVSSTADMHFQRG